MKTWNQLFVRQGFKLKARNGQRFDCFEESEENVEFLLRSLDQLSIHYRFGHKVLEIISGPCSEEEWLKVVDFKGRGRTEAMGGALTLEAFDTYISGLVVELNRLGFMTVYSCDGHGRRPASIYFMNEVTAKDARILMEGIFQVKVHQRGEEIRIRESRMTLLDMTEVLHELEECSVFKDKSPGQFLFEKRLEQLLLISGESGEEENIRELVHDELEPMVDHITVDGYGNLLALKQYRSGKGPTILLNAHLDTVRAFTLGRIILKDQSKWCSSAGILGADDRAGVAIILEVINLLNQSRFNGTVKVIFTVEEEIGLKGARNVDPTFLWDVDAAFVVDRRGTSDIVTSCGGYESFCSDGFGQWVESVAQSGGHTWNCTTGGSSDARIWASQNIPTVNFSAGYQNEHTDAETLSVDVSFQTVKVLGRLFDEYVLMHQVLLRDKRIPGRSVS